MYYLNRNAAESDASGGNNETSSSAVENQDLSKASNSIPRPATTENPNNNNKKPQPPQKQNTSPTQKKEQTKGNLDNNATPSKRGYRAKPVYRVKDDSDQEQTSTEPSVEKSNIQTSTQPPSSPLAQDNTPNRGYKKRAQKVFRPVQSQGEAGTSYDLKK